MKTSVKIIIADDDLDDQSMVSEIFDEIGIADNVRLFKNGGDLLHYLDNVAHTDMLPELILEINAPVNGLSDLNALKENSLYESIPIMRFPKVETKNADGNDHYRDELPGNDQNLTQYLAGLLRFAKS